MKAIANISDFVKTNKTTIVRTTLIVTGVVTGIIAGGYVINKLNPDAAEAVNELGETIIILPADITNS